MRRPRLLRGVAAALILAVLAWWAVLQGANAPVSVAPKAVNKPQAGDWAHEDASSLITRGAYLARVGNCAGCHTAPGGASMAGGRAIGTPFGAVYAGNLTPHATGLAQWSADDLWRAMHHGQSRNGRLLLPAFPYTDYTHVSRADTDALWAYLQSLPAVDAVTPAHELRWPFNTQSALVVWRALYFEPGQPPALAPTGATVERGRYLVQGLGHCAACHSPRTALGGIKPQGDLAGGLMAAQGWLAPSLRSATQAGVAHWSVDDIVSLLQVGTTRSAAALGPMAEVVAQSTQHLHPADLQAMALYLQSLPQERAPHVAAMPSPTADAALRESLGRGAKLYEHHCAQCHGEQGQGAVTTSGQRAYPPLAGNRAVALTPVHNLVQVMLRGGFGPATVGNPQPFGMPPFAHVLADEQIADILSYIRQAWGHAAPPVSHLDVLQARKID
jgi:mono/diheme cytochrome c family protein